MHTFKDAATGAPYRWCYLCSEVKPDDHAHWHNRFGERTKLSCTGCCYALPPLQRDLPNPMKLYAEKACKRCGTVKPNTFEHFGKKLWRSRDEYTTVDVCDECRLAKVRATWDRRNAEAADYRERRDAGEFRQN